MGSYTPWFPEPGSYIRYLDYATGEAVFKYRKLEWRRDPMRYPLRLSALSAGSKATDPVNLDEINPSSDKRHIYLAYIGVKPGFLYYLWHPVDIKTMKWDERITDIDEDLVACLTYESSPYEYPTKTIGVEHDRYPGIQPKNISGETKTPEIIIIAALYKVVEHEKLSQDEIAKLQSGAIRSFPWDFGGEI